VLIIASIVVLVASIIQEKHQDTDIRSMLDNTHFTIRFAVLYVAVMAIVIFGIYGSGYNAADFVYMQF
jgi:hypothetical protein